MSETTNEIKFEDEHTLGIELLTIGEDGSVTLYLDGETAHASTHFDGDSMVSVSSMSAQLLAEMITKSGVGVANATIGDLSLCRVSANAVYANSFGQGVRIGGAMLIEALTAS